MKIDPMVSVLVLTKNEEADLPDCLASIAWCGDVHVLDSYSADRTVEIARQAGASVSLHEFIGYASQRNFGLSLAFKHSWVLVLDADERVPAELTTEIIAFVNQVPSAVSAARIRRRDIFRGRWLKHAQISPYYIRLLRVGHARYEREINEVMVIDGLIADLSCAFDHYPFSKGLDHWIAKHNHYSRMEAEVVAARAPFRAALKTALTDADFNVRRLHQKALFYKLPARPILKFCYMMVIRRAFLDGWPGVTYAMLQSIYEYFIVLKAEEIRRADR